MSISEIRDIFEHQGQPSLPPKQNPSSSSNRPSSVQREQISNSLIALPRPPSRHGSAILSGTATVGRTRSTQSPVPSSLISDNKLSIAKQNNVKDNDRARSTSPGSENSISSRPAFGTSRGPSPLTLGMSDVIPLAVAFQEVCHACFQGADESQCQVRQIGDMMISFPAGIVQLFANNPNSTPLMFRIRNAHYLETVLPNRHLIST